jgi:hypothetical protein
MCSILHPHQHASSGENSMKNGRCTANQGFSIDQSIDCTCTATPTTKDAFVGKCVIDKVIVKCLPRSAPFVVLFPSSAFT